METIIFSTSVYMAGLTLNGASIFFIPAEKEFIFTRFREREKLYQLPIYSYLLGPKYIF